MLLLCDTNSIQCQATETNTVKFCNDIHHVGIKNKTKQNKNNETLGTDTNNQIWKKIIIITITFYHIFLSNVEKSKESYPGLSSTTDESSDSRSDWTEDVDDADEGRSMMGTDP